MKVVHPSCPKCSETVPALLGSTVVCPMCGEHIPTEGLQGEEITEQQPTETPTQFVYRNIGRSLARFFPLMLIFAVICGGSVGMLLKVMDPRLADWVGVISMFILLPVYSLADCIFNRDLVWCPLRASLLQLTGGLAIFTAGGFPPPALETTCIATTVAWIAAGVFCLIARVLIES